MEQLGLGADFDLENLDLAGLPTGIKVVTKGTPIFPRLLIWMKEIAYIKEQMESGKPAIKKGMEARRSRLTLNRKEIKFDDFDKLKFVSQKSKKFLKWKGVINYSIPLGCWRCRKSSNPLWDC